MYKKYKLVIFDADGTLTPQRQSSTAPAILELLENVDWVTKALVKDGTKIAIASNQSSKRLIGDIESQLNWTRDKVGADLILWAYEKHIQKPNPNMLLAAAAYFGVNYEDCLFVGDQETDKKAAQAAGMDFQWADDYFMLT